MPVTKLTHSILMEQVDEAEKKQDFIKAKSLLSVAHNICSAATPRKAEDPYIIQRLALFTYKSKYPSEETALQEARELLKTLIPETSNDTETLGLWGSVHKRLWGITKDPALLDEAVRAYERGFYLRNDYYNGINLAYLLNVRAANSSEPAEAVADFVQARRVRTEVLSICRKCLSDNPAPDAANATEKALKQYQKARYWILATMAEAYLGLGDKAQAERQLAEAYAVAPEDWMKNSTQEQIDNLKPMLENSPLKYIKTDVITRLAADGN